VNLAPDVKDPTETVFQKGIDDAQPRAFQTQTFGSPYGLDRQPDWHLEAALLYAEVKSPLIRRLTVKADIVVAVCLLLR
jgi:hypothetical protein